MNKQEMAMSNEMDLDWLARMGPRKEFQANADRFKPSIEEANRLAQEFKPFISIEDNQEQEMKQDNGWFERGELPPVGVECEILWNDAEWHKTKILAHIHIDKFNVCPVFTTEWDDTAFVDCMPHYKSFRPIRTERDELIGIIASNLSGTTGQVADAILAAGFKLEAK